MAKKMSQCDQILQYMRTHGGINPDEAIQHIKPRCFRLAARIADLKKRGHIIITDLTDGYATYSLIEEGKNNA